MADVSMLFNILARDQTAGGLNSASSRMDKFKARTSIAAIGILGAATAIGAKAIAIASDTSESASKVATLLGDYSDGVMEFADTSATAYGIAKGEALNAVGAMAAVDRAMGTGKAAAAKLAVEYTKLSADLGSFNNASSAEVQEALTASLSGEYEMLKKYGIVVNDTTLANEAQRIGMKKHGATWDSAQKRQLSYNIIMASTKAAQGDFARTSSGMANQTKILEARMTDLQGAIGAKLLPIVVSILGKMNAWGTWMQEHERITKILAVTIGGLAAAIVGIAVGMRIVSGVIALNAAAWRLLATVMWANPVFLIAGIILGIGVALVVAYNKCAWFRGAVNAVFSAVRDFIVGAWDAIKYKVNLALKVMGGAYLTFAGGVLGVFEGLLRGASKLPKWLGGGKFDDAANAVAKIRGGIQSMKDKLDELPTSKKMEIALDTATAMKRIAAVRDALGRIPGVTNAAVNVNTRVAYAEAGGSRSTFGGQTRASGGPVTKGGAYLVGEEGPEIVTFGHDGYVHPNGTGGGRRGAGGGVQTVVHQHVLTVEGNSGDLLVQLLRRHIRINGGNVQTVLGAR